MQGVQPAAKAIPKVKRAGHATRIVIGKGARVFVECRNFEEADELKTEGNDDCTAR